MKLSIIIPMYNEENNVISTSSALLAAADTHPEYQTEILFVNDGSKDSSAAKAAEASKADARIIPEGYSDNHGKGYAVRYGMLHASGDIRVFTDCDLAYGTDAVYALADRLVQSGADLCIGSRAIAPDGYEGYTFARKIMSRAYLKFISVAAGFRHSDSQSGLKGFTAETAQEIFSRCTVDRFAFDLEVLMIADKFGYTVAELPAKVINHNEAQSKVNPVKDALRMLSDIRKMKKRIKTL